jgi:hypothetical protein
VAAGLLVGIGLQYWQWRFDRRIDALFGPPALPSSLADTLQAVESVAGRGGGRWLRERHAISTARSPWRRDHETQPLPWPVATSTLYQVSSLE